MKKISLKNLTPPKKKKNKIKLVFNKIVLKIMNFLKLPSKFFYKKFKRVKQEDKTKKIKKHKISIFIFIKNIIQRIKKNKVLSNPSFRRVVIILFFLGINIQLLPFFLKTNRVKLPDEILIALDDKGFINKDDYIFEYIPEGLKYDEPSLDVNEIHNQLNTEFLTREKDGFIYSDRLATAAAELLIVFEKIDFELGDGIFSSEFKTALDNANYNYEHVSQNMVVGPLKEAAVIDAWLSNEQQLVALFDDDFEEIGLATKIIKTKHNETLGVTVQVLGKELKNKPPTIAQQVTNQAIAKAKAVSNFPPISNEEVFEALNSYRKSHKVSRLTEDKHLCEYAEKRVQDLVELGSLDNHDGFKIDFEDPQNPPEAIRSFNGDKIAENLAFQNCKNMTTGDGFVAQTGTAIIEWCFDSSTAGHKEAQLNRDFGHGCVRNQDGFFVVIFGKR